MAYTYDYGDEPSWRVPLNAFRQIMYLPMTLDSIADKAKIKDWIPSTLGRSPEWTEIDVSRAHAPPHALQHPNDVDAHSRRSLYAEAAYFHPSVRSLLDAGDHVHLFRHRFAGGQLRALCGYGPSDGIARLGADQPIAHAFDVSLHVDRCDLYVWPDPGLAVLVVELCAALETPVALYAKGDGEGALLIGGKPHVKIGAATQLSLAEALALHDSIRRVYPPFFENSNENPGAHALPFNSSLFPSRVELKANGRNETFEFDEREAGRCLSELSDRKRTPMAPWWRRILSVLFFEDAEMSDERQPKSDPPRWRQIVDDRMPTVAFVALGGLGAVTRGDFVRLCFADNPGTGALPYDERFLAGFEERHCYDRFLSTGTRYMASNYTFCCVAQTGGPPNPNFNWALDVIQEHARRHYAQMFLLLQVQRAGLLMFSHWMSKEMAREGSLRNPHLAMRLTDIRHAFAEFTHRFWFRNLSNQLQARELFDLMQRESGARDLYDEVAAECDMSAQTLESLAQQRQQSAAITLNALFALSALVTTPLVVLQGMELFSGGAWRIDPRFYAGIVAALLIMTAFVVAAAARLQLEGRFWPLPWIARLFSTRREPDYHAGALSAVRVFIIVCVLAAAAAIILAFSPWAVPL